MDNEEMTEDDKEKLKVIRREKAKVLKNIEGLEYLFECKVLKREAAAVAKFFMEENNRLSKLAIGTYLGEVLNEFNMAVLDAFTRLHDFREKELIPSLRLLLTSFQLPGESQKIDRVLDSFSISYLEQNPKTFHSAYEVYVLVYAAILLNTSMHNTNAKKQNLDLTLEKVFVRTLLDYDDKTALPEDVIRKVYHDIKNDPIRLESSDTGTKLMNGWLMKLGGRVKSWKRRWFVLTEDSLTYYLTPDHQRSPKGVITLEGLNIRSCPDRTKEHSFELFSKRNGTIKACKTEKDSTSTPGHHSVYRLAASTASERDKWFQLLQTVVQRVALRRGVRSSSVDCSSGSGMTNRQQSQQQPQSQTHRRLPSPVASTTSTAISPRNLKRTVVGAGSHPDLPSQQQSVLP